MHIKRADQVVRKVVRVIDVYYKVGFHNILHLRLIKEHLQNLKITLKINNNVISHVYLRTCFFKC